MADENAENCSRCEGPLDTGGSPHWCKACRAKYQREYQRLRVEMANGKGFAAGVRQTKEILATEFERLGSGRFEGYEVAALIRQAPGPLLDS